MALALLFALTVAPAEAQEASTGSSGNDGAQPERTVHAVPFGSADNAVEIAVRNALPERGLSGLTVRLADAPDWVVVEPDAVELTGLGEGAEATARFTFAIAESAPVGEEAALRFEVVGLADGLAEAEGEPDREEGVFVSGTSIWVEAAAPESFRLVGAYPNPFRDRSVVAYDLPQEAAVTFSVYDVLGRRVARLVEDQSPGRNEAIVEGQNLASGLYLWQLVVEGADSARRVEQGRLTLTK